MKRAVVLVLLLTPFRPATAADVTYNKDVAPILFKHCAACHRPGEVGPFSLLTYRDAAKRADFLKSITADRRMPPWKAEPGFGEFLDARRLSDAELTTLAAWADGGAKEGDAKDLPKAPTFPEGWQLGTPDLVLKMPKPFTVPAGGRDVFRCFVIPTDITEDRTVRAVEFRPGNRRVVHHSRVHVDSTGDARRREQADSRPGFSGFYGNRLLELPYPGLGAWTPGMTPRFAPEGTGRVLARGSEVVLNIHYHPTGKTEVDRSSVGLYFARKPVTRTMAGYTLCTTKIDIPPGEKRYTVILASRVKANVHLHTVVPHAHHLCREFRLAATLPDGTSQPLLWIQDWNLDWQDQYRFAKPVRLPEGTILTLAAYFDNSADNPRNPNKPPRRVRYGVTSDEEMCACHLELLPDDPSGYAAYPNKSPFGL